MDKRNVIVGIAGADAQANKILAERVVAGFVARGSTTPISISSLRALLVSICLNGDKPGHIFVCDDIDNAEESKLCNCMLWMGKDVPDDKVEIAKTANMRFGLSSSGDLMESGNYASDIWLARTIEKAIG